MSASRGTQIPVQDSEWQRLALHNRIQDLVVSKTQKQKEHARLLQSTEKCVKQQYLYKRQNLVTGDIPDMDYTTEQILNSRPEIPELLIQSLEAYPRNNYITWAEQVGTYLFARGVFYVLEEADEMNLPGIYDSLNTTLRDRDDALARFILSTALTKEQCMALVPSAETAKQVWTAIRRSYGPRDGSSDLTTQQILARLGHVDEEEPKRRRKSRGQGRRRNN